MYPRNKFLSAVAFTTLLGFSCSALAYETTTFNISLSDATKTGTMSLGNASLGNATASITTGGTVYNYATQYFTPTSSGTYVFGQLNSPADTVILLYSPTFDDVNPDQSFVEMNDDGNSGSIMDVPLKTYVDTAIASRACDSDPDLCPLLVSSLTSGIDYYLVVSTYFPGDSLGAPTDTLSFFVIGDALVGVGGVPAASSGYTSTAQQTAVSNLANYLGDHDDSGDLATVATHLDTLSQEQVIETLKTIFPVNASLAPQLTGSAAGQTSNVLIEKVGTVLGSLNTPSSAGFANGSFNSSKWFFGSGSTVSTPDVFKSSFTQNEIGTPDYASDSLVNGLASLPYQKFESENQAFWIQGVGAYTNGDSDKNTLAYDVTNAGVVTGYEYALSPDSLVGVIASAFKSYVDLEGSAGEIDSNTYSLGVFGQHLLGSVKVTGIFLASYSQYDSERFVNVGGISGSPKVEYDGWGTSTTVGVSKLFEHEQVKIEPFVNVNFSTASTEDYSETGGGVYNVDVSS
ncbi:MAG: autotransporter domain-containing protein, partial [Alphaproteobacteria bacterium]|nr:autotransporter domain-containing protein [Alphaproteobacteria bacterium]